MTISIDFANISTNLLGKQTNNSDQGAMVRWLVVPRVAKLKINEAQRKFILEFVKQCRDKQWQQYQ